MKELVRLKPSDLHRLELAATVGHIPYQLGPDSPIGVVYQAVRWAADQILDHIREDDPQWTGTYRVLFDRCVDIGWTGAVTFTSARKLIDGAPAAGFTVDDNTWLYEVRWRKGTFSQYADRRAYLYSILVHELSHQLQNRYRVESLLHQPRSRAVPTQSSEGRQPYIGTAAQSLAYYGSIIEMPAYIVQFFSDWVNRYYASWKWRDQKRVLVEDCTDSTVAARFWQYVREDQGSAEFARLIEASPPHLALASELILAVWQTVKTTLK